MRRALVILCLALAPVLFAQSADQEILSVTDAPDPAVPGNNITYTVQIRNNGPDPAVNGGMNANFPGGTYVSASGPAGFTCGAFGQAASCTNPSFPAGETATFTLVINLPSSLISFPDGSITTNFSTSGVTPDPNNGNNNDSETTSYDTPQIDMAISVTDSPDPVFPNGTITYTIPVTNNGPDTGTNGIFSSFNNGSLRFQSATIPAGWNCTLPSVGSSPTFSCTKPAVPPGTENFTVVVLADPAILGVNDGTVSIVFSASATGNETNNANGQEQEDTAYVTPDADVSVAVVDSPDPVFPDGNITYTVTVANNGPDAAPSVTLSSFGSNNLRFVSATVPAGWNCTLPAAGAQTAGFSCTLPTGLANGASSELSFVLQATDELLGVNDGTIQFGFTATSTVADPNGSNNTETESTAYVTPDADISVAVVDSPDPVFPDGNITYTVTVANSGPDAAPTVTLGSFGSNNLRFVSASVPAGWNCTLPAAGAQTAGFTCTLPTGLANGANSVLSFVLQATDELIGINDTTIQFGFTANSNIADPDGSDNSETENTAYVTPDAEMAVSVSDSPDPVTPNNNITYTAVVTNNGPDAATNATLNVFNNGSLRFQSASVPAGWNCTLPAVNATPTFTCTNPSLANGGSSTFTVVVSAMQADIGIVDTTLSTSFTVSSGAADPNGTNNSETENTAYVTPDADLSVTNADAPDPVTSGGTITYTQTITNGGPDAAPNTAFSQTLPASVGFQSLANPAGWSCTTPAVGASGAINCTHPSFASGATGTFTLLVTVLASSGTVTNTVVAGSAIEDPDNTDNSATVTTTILAPVIADLEITKSTTATNAAPGSMLSYTIVLTNNGPDDAANVVVTDTLPAALLFHSITVPAGFTCTTPAVGASGTITCTAPTFADGTTVTFGLVVTVASNATGTINNTATATSDTTDTTPGNSTGNAGAVAVGGTGTSDLSVIKSTATTEVDPGDTITYTIAVTNNGPDAASDVVMTDTLPASLRFQSITPAAGFTCVTPAAGTTGTITCSGGTIANGATATFTLVTTVAPDATGSIVNGATAGTSDSDPDPADSTDTSPGIAVESADLSITKTTPSASAPVGSTITYTVTVTNNGPDAATNVVVSDDLPAGLQFVSATPSQGTCSASDPITCNLGGLANGASATITIQALVTATSGTISNTATVTGAEDDGNPGNNGSTTPPIPVTPAAAPAEQIPTLSEWMLLALAAMLGVLAIVKMR